MRTHFLVVGFHKTKPLLDTPIYGSATVSHISQY